MVRSCRAGPPPPSPPPPSCPPMTTHLQGRETNHHPSPSSLSRPVSSQTPRRIHINDRPFSAPWKLKKATSLQRLPPLSPTQDTASCEVTRAASVKIIGLTDSPLVVNLHSVDTVRTLYRVLQARLPTARLELPTMLAINNHYDVPGSDFTLAYHRYC